MENKLKPVTNQIIEKLKSAEVEPIMATGDNVLTAISVAQQCGIIDGSKPIHFGDLHIADGEDPWISWHMFGTDREKESIMQDSLPWDYKDTNISVALTGRAFRLAYDNQEKDPYVFRSILARGKVFARMSPDDKALLVDSLQTVFDMNVGMCGDGANDCGALKTASVGISLSEAEASIAAPFTAKVQDIGCVVTLLREGKCALVTAFQAFKFMFMYAMIEMIGSIMLYPNGSVWSDGMFVYIDLIALLPLCIMQTWTGSYHDLTRDMPASRLFSFPVLLSIGASTLSQFVA